MNWPYYAALSALFAGMTALFAKIASPRQNPALTTLLAAIMSLSSLEDGR